MSNSTVTDLNLGGSKQSVNGGRRKTKGNEFTQKKDRQPKRGMGVAQLERLAWQENCKKMMELPPVHPHHLPPFVQNAAVHFRHTPAMLIHGANMFPMDHVVDPAVTGASNGGFRFENPRELYSIPNYMKCGSDGCGICHKKKRIAGGINHCSVSPFRSFSGNTAAVEMTDAGKTLRTSRQVTEVMSVNRNGGGSMTEYEFFPGKGGGAEEYKELMSIGSTATRCCSCASAAGAVGLGLRGGEGSCMSAVTGSEEGSVSSIDLSLKLSY